MNKEECEVSGGEWVERYHKENGVYVKGYCRERRMHLQGIGDMKAHKASDIKVGDVLIWNYGSKSRVISVRDVSPKTIQIGELSDNGQVYYRRLSKNRNVVIGKRG